MYIGSFFTKFKYALTISIAVLFGYFAGQDENAFFGVAVFLLTLAAFDTLDIAHFLPLGNRRRPFWLFLTFFIIFRTFFYDVMYVPSESMTPTLLTGDYVLVKKCAYGFNRESFWPLGKMAPWLPTVQWRNPERGDLTVWTRAQDPVFTYYVKRTIAIDGDTFEMKNGLLFLNGKECKVEEMENMTHLRDDGLEIPVKVYKETFPESGLSRLTIRDTEFGQAYHDNTTTITLPEKHFAIIGDNRTNGGSGDSRDTATYPPMPYKQIIGQAKLVIFSTTSWKKFDKNVSWARWIVESPVRLLYTFLYLRTNRFLKPVH